MSIFAWNVRGMNSAAKQSDVLHMISVYKPTIIALLENKLSTESYENFCLKMNNNWKSVSNNDCNCKGRIILMWDTNIWTNINTNTDKQFIDSQFKNIGGFNIQITSVYGSNFEVERNDLWCNLKKFNQKYNLPWIVLGDFNTVFRVSEKSGGNKIPQNKIDRLCNFLMDTGLIEPIISGNKYTWKSGLAKNIHCKLDRILINVELANIFPNFICSTLEQNSSDHTPLFVNLSPSGSTNNKVPPFRFKNSWVLEDSYNSLMNNSLNFSSSGTKQFQFSMLLKNIKHNIKNWDKNNHLKGNSINKLRKDGKYLQNLADNNPQDKEIAKNFFQNQENLSIELHKNAINARQKAKVDWLTLGDDCTKFFYAKMNSRKHINNIGNIIDRRGNFSNEHEKISKEAIEYYKDLYFSENQEKDFPHIICKNILKEEAADILLAPVSLEEIKYIIFNASDNKSPGPDGFNAKFYKNQWNNLKHQIHETVNEFMSKGKILKSTNHTFITLIPKKKNPTNINDFRPISCCNFIYKIISTVLSNRIKIFLPFLVSENQSAFVPGRLISENSMLAHEMVRNFNNKNGDNVCLKIDLQKAYDKVNRHFIWHIMRCMGFPIKFCDLILECINTPTFSILIQGKPEGFISSNRGIRQGDPLSPYLFTLVMEYFSILMDIETIKGNIKHINRIQPYISHLIYADDLMIFVKANKENAESVKNIFARLNKNAGLQLNKTKSKAYFSKSSRYKMDFLNVLKITEGNLPVKYLGLPLSVNQLRDSDCSGLLDNIQERMEVWSCKLLSIAGRLELIKTVIYAIILYWLQTFHFPATSIKKIEKKCADFLWRGKYHKISWDKVCKPKEEVGFGIRNLKDLSSTCHLKLFWRFLSADSLWARWMQNKYVNKGNFWNLLPKNNQSNTWKHILKCRDIGRSLLDRNFKDGKETNLWFDPWFKNNSFVNKIGWNNLVIFGEPNLTVSSIILNNHWHPHLHPITNPHKEEICKLHIDVNAESDYWT
jgi:exonuclease III